LEQNILLARQPIYSEDLSLHGFELLFRSQHNLNALDVGEDAATFEVLVNYCTSISKEIDNTKYPLFVNVSETFLLSDALLPMEQSRVVLELLERITVTDELVEAVARLHRAGYRFALDDYDFDPKWAPFVPYVELIKVDVLEADMAALKVQKESMASFKGKWLAERIEDHERLQECIDLGFTLFQGYVLAKPQALLGNKIQGSTAVTVEVIRLCGNPEAEIDQIAERVSQDPKLSIQLLKLVNSPMVNLNREVSDIKQAITYLGIDLLKRWAMMIAFVSNDNAPMEASRIILTRAKCCELYFEANETLKDQNSSAFLVGLISGVDVLLALDPKFFVEQIQFSPEIQNAILKGEGTLADVVKQTRLIEFFLSQSLEKIKEIPSELLCHYSEAQRWAGDVIESLESPA